MKYKIILTMIIVCTLWGLYIYSHQPQNSKELNEPIYNEIIQEAKAIEDVALVQTIEPPEPIVQYEAIEMLYTSSVKTYMDYRAITDKTSPQYQFIHSDEITICEDGFLRDSEGYIGVAMGGYFGEVGSRYICRLDNGVEIKVVKVEVKAEQDTVQDFYGKDNYDIIEFVIDTKAQWMQDNKWENGYIFSGNFNNYEAFNGKIVEIDKVIK